MHKCYLQELLIQFLHIFFKNLKIIYIYFLIIFRYYHPSNSGSWTTNLGKFMRQLCNSYASRIHRGKLIFYINIINHFLKRDIIQIKKK